MVKTLWDIANQLQGGIIDNDIRELMFHFFILISGV